MKTPPIDKWIDFDGVDFNRLENVGEIRRLIMKSIGFNLYLFDKDGHVFYNGEPIYAELDGKYVGIRYPLKACS